MNQDLTDREKTYLAVSLVIGAVLIISFIIQGASAYSKKVTKEERLERMMDDLCIAKGYTKKKAFHHFLQSKSKPLVYGSNSPRLVIECQP